MSKINTILLCEHVGNTKQGLLQHENIYKNFSLLKFDVEMKNERRCLDFVKRIITLSIFLVLF